MARLIRPGTPARTDRYVFPRLRRWLFGASFGGALVLAGLLAGAGMTRFRAIAAPGPIASPHVGFEQKCEACHAPSAAAVRCESCHDAFGTGRYENAAHVRFGTSDPVRIARADWLECAHCHTDHRGRAFPIARTDDRDCRGCHFSSMKDHPEFAIVRAKVQKDEGLLLSHKKHLKAVRKARLEDCQYCHEPTRDRSGFEPPSFDRHCASCHLKNGTMGPTDPIPAEALVLPQDSDPSIGQGRRADPDSKGQVVVGKLVHKDPWVLANIWRIAREVDPEGFAARRAALESKAAALLQESKLLATRPVPASDPKAERIRLETRLASLGPASRPDERRSLERRIARISLEAELGPLPTAALRPRARRQLDEELARVRSELAFFDLAGTARLTLSTEERQRRLAAVAPLTAACALCHVYDGAIQRRVHAGVPVLLLGRYVHLPHLQQVACAACHARIEESKKAEDVNLPAVATCEGCHRPGRSRSDCAECHVYHPGVALWPPS